MELEIVNINDLISPDYNPRRISDKDKEKLKQSITEFDYIEPIIVNDVNNHIIGGNQRYNALKELGYEEIEVVYTHIEDLNREKSANIALNKISGDWDTVKLENVLSELSTTELDLTGFDKFEIELFKNEELDTSDLMDYETSDDELPDDYVDVTGHDANKNYVVSIAFPSKEEANVFVEAMGCEKTMKRDTLQLHIDELNMDLY